MQASGKLAAPVTEAHVALRLPVTRVLSGGCPWERLGGTQGFRTSSSPTVPGSQSVMTGLRGRGQVGFSKEGTLMTGTTRLLAVRGWMPVSPAPTIHMLRSSNPR